MRDDTTWRRRTLLRVAALALAVGGVVGLPASPAHAEPISPAPAPTLVGDPRPGENLFIDPGEWPADTALTYEWLLDGVKEPGANGPAWTVRQVDIDVVFQVAVTGSKAGYDDVRTVSEPVTILGEQQVLRPTPAVVGRPRVGKALTATPGAWDAGTTQTFAWLRAGHPIAGATGTSYTPRLADLGAPLSFRVTSTRPGYSKVVSTSAPTSGVARGTQKRGEVRISGAPKVGRTLRARLAGFEAGTTRTYRWLVGGRVRGTRSSLVLTRNMIGKRVVLRAVLTKPGYETLTVASRATGKVAAVTRTARVGAARG